jgi:hypothetical protein
MLLFHRPESDGIASQTFRLTILPTLDEKTAGIIGGAALDGGAERYEMYYLPDLAENEKFKYVLQALVSQTNRNIYKLLCLEFTDAYENGLSLRLLKEEAGFDRQADDDDSVLDSDLDEVHRRVEGTLLEEMVNELLIEWRQELAAIVFYVRQAGRMAGLQEDEEEGED